MEQKRIAKSWNELDDWRDPWNSPWSSGIPSSFGGLGITDIVLAAFCLLGQFIGGVISLVVIWFIIGFVCLACEKL